MGVLESAPEFVEDWVVSKNCTTLEEFLKGCEACAYFLDTGKW
jgi:hypothetical protein